MKYSAENAVSSFFYYMWNAWSKEECKVVFGGMCKHFWEKWNSQAGKSIYGAAERFYSELSENNQRLLVDRAVALYDGKAFREEPDDSEILVCCKCGSIKVEIQVWVDANTDEYLSDVDDDSNGMWCAECEDNTRFSTKTEFLQKMQTWWDSRDFTTMERITGLREQNYPSDDGSQAFVDATNEWWNSRDYDTKRTVYNEYNFNK